MVANSLSTEPGVGTVSNPLANDSTKGWVVQKFGGTSVGKFPDKICEHVVRPYMDEAQVALVCSARSSATKAEGTTNRLLRAAKAALDRSEDYATIVHAIAEDHAAAAREFIRSDAIRQELQAAFEFECRHLQDFLKAAQVLQEISPKTKDIIMATGEKLSCRFMAAALQDRGIDAAYISMDHVVPMDYEPKSTGLDHDFYVHVAREMGKAIRKVGAKVPVATGFFGIVPGSLLNQIGRGYTDLCAALVAIALGADELQIWKEVDGIFTADPRKVPTARLLSKITPEEAAELTYYGSEVIHPFTMEQVIRERIPIRIKNVDNPAGEGTVIFPDNVTRNGAETPPHPPKSLSDSFEDFGTVRAPTAVTIKDSIMVINVQSNRKIVSHGFFASIFQILDRYCVVVDLISTSEVHISMALNADVQELDLKPALEELRKIGTVDVLRNMAILSLVGKQMKNMIGVAGKMFSTLATANINMEMISQGASEINISCVINESDSIKALSVIHQHLLNSASAVQEMSAFSAIVNDKPWLLR